MPEERGLYPKMRVDRQLRYLAILHGMEDTEARRAAGRWLERLGIADRAGQRVEELSLGNQQRVQLAAALVHDPDVLSWTSRSPASTRSAQSHVGRLA
jgi:ABC-2 type transport system ATP-binding protein